MLVLMKHLDIRVDQEYLDYYMQKVILVSVLDLYSLFVHAGPVLAATELLWG